MSVCVDQRFGMTSDCDMAFPEHEVTAAQAREGGQFPHRQFLHVAVAWASDPGSLERNLHQARAIQPQRGLAAPQIRCTKKMFGDGYEVGLPCRDWRDVCFRHMPSQCSHREALILPYDGQLCAHRKRGDRRHSDVRTREGDCAETCDLVSGRRTAWSQRVRRQPTDIAVCFELAPSPAVLGRFINHYPFTQQRFAVEPGVMRRRTAQGSHGLDHLMASAFDEALRFDLTLQILCRNLGPKRIYARVESNHGSGIARAKQRIQSACGLAFSAFRTAGLFCWSPGENVEVHPRFSADETAQKKRSGDGAAMTARRRVVQIGNL